MSIPDHLWRCPTGEARCSPVFPPGTCTLLDTNPLCTGDIIDLGSISGDTGADVISFTGNNGSGFLFPFGEVLLKVRITENDTGLTARKLGMTFNFTRNLAGSWAVVASCDDCFNEGDLEAVAFGEGTVRCDSFGGGVTGGGCHWNEDPTNLGADSSRDIILRVINLTPICGSFAVEIRGNDGPLGSGVPGSCPAK